MFLNVGRDLGAAGYMDEGRIRAQQVLSFNAGHLNCIHNERGAQQVSPPF